MPGTSMCARPRSAVCIMCCPMARSCLSVRTIRCTAQIICIRPASGRRWNNDELPFIGAALARTALLSAAAGLHWHSAVQHGDTGLLCETAHFVRRAAQALCALARSAGKCCRRPARGYYAVLYLYRRSPVPGHAGGRSATWSGHLLPAGLTDHQSGGG